MGNGDVGLVGGAGVAVGVGVSVRVAQRVTQNTLCLSGALGAFSIDGQTSRRSCAGDGADPGEVELTGLRGIHTNFAAAAGIIVHHR